MKLDLILPTQINELPYPQLLLQPESKRDMTVLDRIAEAIEPAGLGRDPWAGSIIHLTVNLHVDEPFDPQQWLARLAAERSSNDH